MSSHFYILLNPKVKELNRSPLIFLGFEQESTDLTREACQRCAAFATGSPPSLAYTGHLTAGPLPVCFYSLCATYFKLSSLLKKPTIMLATFFCKVFHSYNWVFSQNLSNG